jgi:hypothetical protein
MEKISNIAANRSVVIRTFSERNPQFYYKKKTIFKRRLCARYRQVTIKNAYKQYVESNTLNEQLRDMRLKVPFSTFHRKIDKRFKKPFRHTDLCDYCEMGRLLEKQIKFLMNDNNQGFNLNEILEYLNQHQQSSNHITKKVELYRAIQFHKKIASTQRSCYNEERLNPELLNGKIVIEIDYKQKILLGQGPRQMNSEFFERAKKKVLCLGIGVYYVDRTRSYPFVNLLNLDVITDYEKQECGDVTRIIRHVMTLPVWKEIDQDNYIIWSDCGTQFRSQEFYYFCFNYLAKQGKCVTLNYFCEKHGINKNIFQILE